MGPALHNVTLAARLKLAAQIRVMPPENTRMRIAETTAQFCERRQWLFSEGMSQDLTHFLHSVVPHPTDLLGDCSAQLWKAFSKVFIGPLPQAYSNPVD
jgi:hypothetical protein